MENRIYLYVFILGALYKSASPELTKNSRLPKTIVPEEYSLKFRIDPEDSDYFHGVVVITSKVNRDTNNIILHAANNLNLTSVLVFKDEKNIFDSWEKPYEDFLSLNLTETLKKGEKCVIRISYTGSYGVDDGFFIRKHIRSDESFEYLVATTFESDKARHAYPCFDEPNLKANFTITVLHPKEYTAVSNMNAKPSSQKRKGGNYTTTTFNTSPKMSTYLVAILVSKYTRIDNYENGSLIYNKLVEVYAHPNDIDRVKYAVDAIQECVKAMEDYLDFEYSLPKLSLAFIPEFTNVALENWGLIFVSDDTFFFDEEGNQPSDKRKLVTNICHEVSHMWFGNEATLNWWDSIWINEGFATLFQNKISDIIYGNGVEIMNEFIARQLIRAMTIEFSVPRKLTLEITEKTDMNDLFTPMYYVKGCGVLRMFNEAMGEDNFKQSLRNYIKKFAGLSVRAEDVSNEFRSVSPEIPEGALESWLDNRGLPVVYALQENQTQLVVIKQKPFSSLTSIAQWYIPLNWATRSHPNFDNISADTWLEPNQNESFVLADKDDWFILNKQLMGYYKVNYDVENWKKISEALKKPNFSGIPLLTRIQLIKDAGSLAAFKYTPYSVTLDIFGYLKFENEYLPWIAAYDTFITLHNIAKNLKHLNRFKMYLRNLVDDKLVSVNGNKSNLPKEFRHTLISIGCKGESEYISNYLNNRINEMKNTDKYDWSMSSTLICYAVQYADESQWNYLFQMFTDEDLPYYKQSYISTLYCSKDEKIAKRLYSAIIDPEVFDNRANSTQLLNWLYLSFPVDVNYLMDFVDKNYGKIVEMHGFQSVKDIFNGLSEFPNSIFKSRLDKFYERYQNILSSDEKQFIKERQDQVDRIMIGRDNLHEIDLWLLENVENNSLD